MKFVGMLLRIFAFSVLLMAIFIGSIAAYMALYGNAHIKKALSELAGARVEFKSIAINLSKQAASFKGFSVASRIGFEKDIFGADTFTVVLNKEKLESQKRIVFDRVYVKGAHLHIVRNARGEFNLTLPKMNTAMLTGPLFNLESTAYASEDQSKNVMYDILNSAGNIRIEDSTITFEDHFRTATPYRIWCDVLFADIVSKDTGAGYLSTTVVARGSLPQKERGDGWFGAKASMAVYPDHTNMELSAEMGNIELMIFLPYFQKSTPFYFRGGRFSSRTDLKVHGGKVDGLTTMYFRNLRLVINPYAPNAQFLNVSIDRLTPYLMSGEDLVFDFVMEGDVRNPQFGLGPKVRSAVGMAAMAEAAKAIQKMQSMQ